MLLEALRVLASNGWKAQNTVEFHWYSGEEGGLRGSADVWKKYKSDGRVVKAFVNTDMAGYSPSGKISVYDDYADVGFVNPFPLHPPLPPTPPSCFLPALFRWPVMIEMGVFPVIVEMRGRRTR